jgi:hypothetical protein
VGEGVTISESQVFNRSVNRDYNAYPNDSMEEQLMNRHRPVAILMTLLSPFFLIGCQRSQNSSKEPSLPARPEPILKIEDDAGTVVNMAIKAHGGEKAFSRWSCGYLKYKTKGGVVPAQAGEVILEDTFQLPGYFKRVTHTNTGGKESLMVFVVDHGKGWSKRDDAPAEPIDNDFTERTEHPFANFYNLVRLTDAGIRLTKLGAEEAIGIHVQSDKLGEVDFYFDSQTALLLKTKKTLPNPDGERPSIMEVYPDHFKDIQGMQVPMQINGSQNGTAVLDIALIEARFADKFEASTFARPWQAGFTK